MGLTERRSVITQRMIASDHCLLRQAQLHVTITRMNMDINSEEEAHKFSWLGLWGRGVHGSTEHFFFLAGVELRA